MGSSMGGGGLVGLLGIAEERLGPGRVRCRLTFGPEHRNIQGVIHGSVTMALLDTAMGHALDGLLAAGEFCSTTQISFQFLRALRPGQSATADGEVVHKGRSVAYLEGTCRDETGAAVARALGTWHIGRAREGVGAAP